MPQGAGATPDEGTLHHYETNAEAQARRFESNLCGHRRMTCERKWQRANIDTRQITWRVHRPTEETP